MVFHSILEKYEEKNNFFIWKNIFVAEIKVHQKRNSWNFAEIHFILIAAFCRNPNCRFLMNKNVIFRSGKSGFSKCLWERKDAPDLLPSFLLDPINQLARCLMRCDKHEKISRKCKVYLRIPNMGFLVENWPNLELLFQWVIKLGGFRDQRSQFRCGKLIEVEEKKVKSNKKLFSNKKEKRKPHCWESLQCDW
jgi:hypothetical protein